MSGNIREAILNIYNLAFGLFLFVSPWLFAFAHGVAGLDAWFSSAVILIISILGFLRFAEWEEWATFGVASWLLISPWLLGIGHLPARIDFWIGILVAYIALLVLWLLHYMPASSEARWPCSAKATTERRKPG